MKQERILTTECDKIKQMKIKHENILFLGPKTSMQNLFTEGNCGKLIMYVYANFGGYENENFTGRYGRRSCA